MSEREMREALRKVCKDLDLEARTRAKARGRKLAYPLMLGAGLLVASCEDETVPPEQPAYGVPSGSPTATQTGSGTASGTTTGTAVGGGGEGGAATGGAGGGDVGGGAVGGAAVEYMAPDP